MLRFIAIPALCCGLVVGIVLSRPGGQHYPTAKMVLRVRGLVTSLTFSADGKRIFALRNNLCQQFDPKSGRVISTWPFTTGPFGSRDVAQFTPDGSSLILVKAEKSLPDRNVAMPFLDSVGKPLGKGFRKHLVKVSTIQSSMSSFDTDTGKLRWKRMVPIGDAGRNFDSPLLRYVSNQHIFVKCHELVFDKAESKRSLLRFDLSNKARFDSFKSSDFGWNLSDGDLFKDDGSWLAPKTVASQDSVELQLSDPNMARGPEAQRYEVRPGTSAEDVWHPLVLDGQEKLLAGVLNAPPSPYSFSNESVRLYVWDAQSQIKWTDDQHNFAVSALAFSPDNRFLALAGTDWTTSSKAPDGRLLVYDVSTGKVVKELLDRPQLSYLQRRWNDYQEIRTRDFTGPAQQLVWSPDSQRLAATYSSYGFRVWQIR
ncbi:hypothetical protein EON80_00510 [bacterium]|nr:MAG: hypothetical protein EON80_00510 [bacterium]